METEPLQIRLAVRELVEFVLRRGSIDSRFSGFDRANEGSRIHRKLQKAAGDSYKAEVPFKAERTVGDVCYTLEGRADGVIRRAGRTFYHRRNQNHRRTGRAADGGF